MLHVQIEAPNPAAAYDAFKTAFDTLGGNRRTAVLATFSGASVYQLAAILGDVTLVADGIPFPDGGFGVDFPQVLVIADAAITVV